MFELTAIEFFSAAHSLRNYQGPCERLHGHNFKVEATISCKKLNELSIGMDFKEIKEILRDILKKLDHTFLNELPYFKNINPTSEKIAHFIYMEMKGKIDNNCKMKEVAVWESNNCKATYIGEENDG
ncbi:MAG: 6-carboxytetrahydropterin synthase QueD [Deltaproteobacteria bacterium]|nr:6-carboxytetrahydropterin synthase QueD [Deltaproteobacteria bacterium]